jgi:hypothetical protein
VLTHHPPEWLTAEAANVLRQELARVLHVHLLGHVHDARAVSAKRHGRSGRSLWYVAGAAHADPSEAAKHGYAWGALRYDPARERWEAGWAPRIFVASHNEMRADRTDHNLDEAGFAWEEIPCGWPAPLGCAG